MRLVPSFMGTRELGIRTDGARADEDLETSSVATGFCLSGGFAGLALGVSSSDAFDSLLIVGIGGGQLRAGVGDN